MTSSGNIRDAIKRAIMAQGRAWSIQPPKGWEHEAEETLDTFVDPDGVGALQFSSMTKTSGNVTDEDLVESIEDMNLAGLARTKAAHGAFSGYALRKEHDDGQVGEYWFLRAGAVLLFATYFCAKEHVGREAGVVKKALDSLRLT